MKKLDNNIPLNQCYLVTAQHKNPKHFFHSLRTSVFQTFKYIQNSLPLISLTVCSGNTMYKWIPNNNYQLMVRAKAEKTAI